MEIIFIVCDIQIENALQKKKDPSIGLGYFFPRRYVPIRKSWDGTFFLFQLHFHDTFIRTYKLYNNNNIKQRASFPFFFFLYYASHSSCCFFLAEAASL